MKTNKILLALAIPAILAGCSKDPELPYDLDGVVHSFAVSVTKNTQHDLLLNAGTTDGEYYVNLDVPQYMGDYSSYFKEAQVLCVYTPVTGDAVSAVAAEGITSFPAEAQIDMAALCEKLGIASPMVGDKMQFTANVVHKDGTVVPGWSSAMGFNNRAPSFLKMADGSAYSYCATFVAAAPLQTAYYAGGNSVMMNGYDDMVEDQADQAITITKLAEIPEEAVKSGFTAADYIGLEIGFDFLGLGVPATFQLFINTRDYSVSAPDQDVATANSTWYYASIGYGEDGPLYFESFSGELNTSTNILTFTVSAGWDIVGGQYDGYGVGWGQCKFIIDFTDVQ